MSTNAPSVIDPNLQLLIDTMLTAIKLPDGSAPAAAPNAFKDRTGEVVSTADTSEFEIVIRTNPGGQTATAKVVPVGSVAASIEGVFDAAVLFP